MTEELKTIEADKIRAIAEKEEFQKKISLVSDNVKKLQVIFYLFIYLSNFI